ncbi:hypothetical protein NPA08_03805 [Mycoplasmopsis citelli]|uniref:hypothetical protein n=1 Tax=Mycoplasmopsis citelli TaxID=171281 RepID=UPI00211566D3|nr:hypothetical protein [Mycoplasmopsis citelli]UUD36052.1 hypothetical protein NPA08_03805 [Mycoplasmopsis citelli]
MINISKKLILHNQNILFDVELPKKEILEILHSGSVENLKNIEFVGEKIEENCIIRFTYNRFNTSKNSRIFNIRKQKLLLNRDFITYNLNGDKQKARYIHYLMLVYSNYQNEKFYVPNHQDNMQYFMHLEKYYQ